MMKNQYKAASCMIIAALSYAVIGAIVKSIDGIPTSEILLIRTSFCLVFFLFHSMKNKIDIRGVNHIGLIGRGVAGFLGAFFYYLALSNIYLADTVAISNIYPFIVILLSAIFLHEKINRYHIVAIILSFSGVLLIIRPVFLSLNYHYLTAVLSAFFTGIAYTVLKYVRKTDCSEVLILYYSTISILGCLPFMIFEDIVIPNFFQWTQLISLGFAGIVYQWFITAAFKFAPAGEVSIYSYSSIIFSVIIGFLFWSEFPDFTTVIGILSIVLGAYIILRNCTEQCDELDKDAESFQKQ